MRSTERFTGLATIYGQARPTYPQELVRWCLEQAPAPEAISKWFLEANRMDLSASQGAKPAHSWTLCKG
jgi:hypothetical protein